MHSKLEEILSKTKQDFAKRKQKVPFEVLKKSMGKLKSRSFINAMRNPKLGTIAIIGEVKFASPTEFQLGSQDSLIVRIKEYEAAGVDAVSIVTEKNFFHGDPVFVAQIKNITPLPVLEKDFIVDEYQIYEAAKSAADAVLLIAKLLSKEKLSLFVELAKKLDIEPVVEINNELDLEKAKTTTARIIAVNSRDLHSFLVDVDQACKLIHKIPDRYIKLGFSGISSRIEVEKYKQVGASGVLIGTSLMKARNIIDYIEGVRV